MSRRRRNANKSEYTQVDSSVYDTADGIGPEQFTLPRRKFPLKQVIFILGFLFAGATCLSIAIVMLLSCLFFDEKYEERIWPLLLLGLLMIIPGAYYGYILICILFKRNGFTYDDIPIF